MILDDIVADKLPEVAERKRELPLEAIKKLAADAPPVRDFAAALKGPRIRLIAEVKKASPSKGVIRKDFDPLAIAQTYAANGASAISVLTDEKYFQGSLDYLRTIRQKLEIPVPLLRKDFIIDEYQIYEARAAGADAILLIVAILDIDRIRSMMAVSHDLGMKCLVETHNEEEMKIAIESGAGIIGINNRDLYTFDVDLATTARLKDLVPEGRIVVSESGIKDRNDMVMLRRWKVDAVLIGESLTKSPDIAMAMKEFV